MSFDVHCPNCDEVTLSAALPAGGDEDAFRAAWQDVADLGFVQACPNCDAELALEPGGEDDPPVLPVDVSRPIVDVVSVDLLFVVTIEGRFMDGATVKINHGGVLTTIVSGVTVLLGLASEVNVLSSNANGERLQRILVT